jgi:hypothetical protein
MTQKFIGRTHRGLLSQYFPAPTFTDQPSEAIQLTRKQWAKIQTVYTKSIGTDAADLIIVLETPARQLTEAELTALLDYAAKHGRNWKQDLRWAWMDASEPGILQQLRNAKHFGPQGLINFAIVPEVKR